MRWKQEEIETAIELLKNGNDFAEIGISLGRTKKSIKEKLNELGYNQSDYVKREFYEIKNCECCKKEFKSLKSDDRKFCSQSCSVKFNNKKREKKINKNLCLNCNKLVKNLYCDSKCQNEHKRNIIFEKIKNGEHKSEDSRIYKSFLISIYGEKCMECGWDKINEFSLKSPLELHHIDCNSDNNKSDNLQLLCPNCHSLTKNWKSISEEKGRYSRRRIRRRKRYEEGKSY
jgi:hypothetical protein